MKRKLFAVSLAALLVLAGCGGGSSSMPSASNAPSGGAEGNYWDVNIGSGEADFMPAPDVPGEPGAPIETENQGGDIYQNPRG